MNGRAAAGAALASHSNVNWTDRARATGNISIAELKRSGVTLAPHEGVAVIQCLIHGRSTTAATPPFGPPSPENVEIGSDGTVICRACEISPAVAELAILLQTLLPPGAPLPGGLRYAVARALHEVDVPPFDSVEEFSAALERYERGERAAVVRRLLRRARLSVAPVAPLEDAAVDRRHPRQSVADIRRELRDIDRQLYERQLSQRQRPDGSDWQSTSNPTVRGRWLALGALCACALLVMLGTGLVRARNSTAVATSQMSARSDIALPTEAAARSVPRRPSSSAAVSRAARVRSSAPVPAAPAARRSRPVFPRIRFAFVDDFSQRR